jgi:hypothetical protein
VTGEVVSKSTAGARAQSSVAEEWQSVLHLALDARSGSVADVPVNELRAACAFVDSLAASI